MGMDRLTLLDIAKQSDPDGGIADIVEVLDQNNPILQDAPAIASNAQMGNRVTRRSSLPTVAWSKINQGVTRSKGSTEQLVDTIGMLVGLSESDSRIGEIVGGGKFAEARWSEDKGFLEAMAQEVASTMLYGSELLDESSFTGFQPRLETAATAITGSQVSKHHDAPSGSDYTSIYVVDWHPDKVALIYPESSTAGVKVQDLGKQRVNDKDGNPFSAFVTEFLWLIGLTVKDARHMARLANIDVSQALTDETFASSLVRSLIILLKGMPSPMGAKRVLYTSRNVAAAMELQVMQQGNVMFSFSEYLGERTLHFAGHPVRVLDQMSETETAIS